MFCDLFIFLVCLQVSLDLWKLLNWLETRLEIRRYWLLSKVLIQIVLGNLRLRSLLLSWRVSGTNFAWAVTFGLSLLLLTILFVLVLFLILLAFLLVLFVFLRLLFLWFFRPWSAWARFGSRLRTRFGSRLWSGFRFRLWRWATWAGRARPPLYSYLVWPTTALARAAAVRLHYNYLLLILVDVHLLLLHFKLRHLFLQSCLFRFSIFFWSLSFLFLFWPVIVETVTLSFILILNNFSLNIKVLFEVVLILISLVIPIRCSDFFLSFWNTHRVILIVKPDERSLSHGLIWSWVWTVIIRD